MSYFSSLSPLCVFVLKSWLSVSSFFQFYFVSLSLISFTFFLFPSCFRSLVKPSYLMFVHVCVFNYLFLFCNFLFLNMDHPNLQHSDVQAPEGNSHSFFFEVIFLKCIFFIVLNIATNLKPTAGNFWLCRNHLHIFPNFFPPFQVTLNKTGSSCNQLWSFA